MTKKTKIRSELSSEAGLAKGRVQSAYKEMLAQYAALISDTHPTIVAGLQDMSNVSDLSHLSDSEEASQEQMIDVIKQVSYRTQQAAEALADEAATDGAESQTGSRCRIRAEDFRAVTGV